MPNHLGALALNHSSSFPALSFKVDCEVTQKHLTVDFSWHQKTMSRRPQNPLFAIDQTTFAYLMLTYCLVLPLSMEIVLEDSGLLRRSCRLEGQMVFRPRQIDRLLLMPTMLPKRLVVCERAWPQIVHLQGPALLKQSVRWNPRKERRILSCKRQPLWQSDDPKSVSVKVSRLFHAEMAQNWKGSLVLAREELKYRPLHHCLSLQMRHVVVRLKKENDDLGRLERQKLSHSYRGRVKEETKHSSFLLQFSNCQLRI